MCSKLYNVQFKHVPPKINQKLGVFVCLYACIDVVAALCSLPLQSLFAPSFFDSPLMAVYARHQFLLHNVLQLGLVHLSFCLNGCLLSFRQYALLYRSDMKQRGLMESSVAVVGWGRFAAMYSGFMNYQQSVSQPRHGKGVRGQVYLQTLLRADAELDLHVTLLRFIRLQHSVR